MNIEIDPQELFRMNRGIVCAYTSKLKEKKSEIEFRLSQTDLSEKEKGMAEFFIGLLNDELALREAGRERIIPFEEVVQWNMNNNKETENELPSGEDESDS